MFIHEVQLNKVPTTNILMENFEDYKTLNHLP